MAEGFLTQPLQIVVGSEGGSKWMSDDLFKTRRQQGQARARPAGLEPHETV
jgi:hypothetical protein